MLIISWNINGIRSAEKQFIDFINSYSPDVLMLQEVRANPDDLSFFIKYIPGYEVIFNPSNRPGWSGTAIYYKTSLNPDYVGLKFNNKILESEGRGIILKKSKLIIINFYTPNGESSEERLNFKLKYYDEIRKFSQACIKKNYKVIIGGDLNVAYDNRDVHPELAKIIRSSILPEERAWFKQMLDIGMVDSFRIFNQKEDFYTWWHMADRKRKKNRGYRFDYFLVSHDLEKSVIKADILKDVYGSDHCPVTLEIKLSQ